MTSIQTAAVGAAVLICGVAAFQLALAMGLALGEATLGGRAATADGVLSGGFRGLALASAAILLLVAWLVLARADLVTASLLSSGLLTWATRGLLGFLILNTLGNFAAPHPVERWVMGGITLTIVVLLTPLALRGQ